MASFIGSNNPEQPLCAGVLIIGESGLLFSLATHDQWRMDGNHCAIPLAGIGGGQEPGEGMWSCALREANEEIGCPVTLLHSAITYIEMDPNPIVAEKIDEMPAPLLYQVQRRTTAEPYALGLPAGEHLHIGIYRAIPSKIPEPHDIPGVAWIPLSSLRAVSEGLSVDELGLWNIKLVLASPLPPAITLFIPKPSTEDLLVRVVERLGEREFMSLSAGA